MFCFFHNNISAGHTSLLQVYRCYWIYDRNYKIQYIDRNVAITIVEKGEVEMKYNIEKKRKTNKDMDYNDSSRQFRPLGSRVMALSIKCVSLALRTESREEWTFPNESNCMSVWEWSEWERRCSETLVGLDLMLVLSTGRLCSLNLSLRQKWPNCVEHEEPHKVP